MTNQPSNETIILSIGGSIIIPETGFDPVFLGQFKKLILERVVQGQRFVLVTGGGATARQYQRVAETFNDLVEYDLDWLGIETTKLNAYLIRLMFNKHAYEKVVTDPQTGLDSDQPIIVAAGWQPGCSTDKDAVLHAEARDAKQIFNLTNTDYVYDSDPRANPNAKKIEHISWSDFRENIVGHSWVPGKNAPFDPIASELAQKLGLRVSILRGTNLDTVRLALEGKPFPGTVIE